MVDTFRLIYRNIIVWVFGSIVTVLLFTSVLLVAPFDRKGNLIHRIGRLWSRLIILLCGVKVEIVGLENISLDTPQILASNHQSLFDIPVIHAHLPIQFRWVSKEEVFRIPFIGWAMSLAGYISIDRARPAKAYRDFLRSAEMKLRDGLSILIFPEGTRSKEDRVQAFKRGGFSLSIVAGLPVVPVSITGTRRVTERFPWLTPSMVKVYIDRPIDPLSLKDRSPKELMNMTYMVISRNFDRIRV